MLHGPKDPIWHILLKFYERHGIPPDEQRWLYDGNGLNKWDTWDLEEGDVLELFVAQYGGGQSESRDCRKADMVGAARPYTLVALSRLLQEFANGKKITEAVSHIPAAYAHRKALDAILDRTNCLDDGDELRVSKLPICD